MGSKITKFFCLKTVENRKVCSYSDHTGRLRAKKKERKKEICVTRTQMVQSKWMNKSELRTSLSIKESDLREEKNKLKLKEEIYTKMRSVALKKKVQQ